MRISVSLIVALAFCASTAHSATFYARSGASATAVHDPADNFSVINASDNDLVNSTIAPNIGDLSGSVSSLATASGTLGSSTGRSSASANTLTGELKVRTSANWTGTGAASGAAADAEIRELFTLNGSGTFTAYMALDASWNLSGNTWAFQAGVDTSFGRDIEIFGTGASSTQSFNNRIYSVSGSFFNVVNRSVSIRWYAIAQQNNATAGFIDASNTATIFFETSDGLTATPSVSSFLSNAVYPDDVSGGTGPAAVPLPASGLMLVSLLAGLFGLRTRRRT
ncbi:VPLPA-CTERM sorting domain-containing protein [uncultured Roseovarius sp.]|uniref:VPLPA-CTERM sorting domain-containing protein n=1 Tax=uncultured Roseovarius sp. TaxID=293344 RepID=UPI002619CC54|nr:VPLPA-CTERM sorting domain-containing protein [uncultured Roseovarius sp.]